MMTPRRRPRIQRLRQSHRGVALLMVLGVLAAVSVGLMALGRQTSAARLGLAAEEGRLQRAWLWRSAERALHDVELFAQPPAPAPGAAPVVARPGHRFDWAFDLGHHRGRLRFADESAKADLNLLLPPGDTDALRRVQVLATELGVSTPLEPRAHGRLEPPWQAFNLPDQIVTPAFINEVRELTPPGVTGPLDVLTLWSGGLLRAARAPEPVTRAVLADLATGIEARRLAEHFALPPQRRPELDPDLARQLAERVRDTPGPQSVRGFLDNGRRRYGGLRVQSGERTTLRFNW